MTKVRLYTLGTSTTLESNKSHAILTQAAHYSDPGYWSKGLQEEQEAHMP
jgi:hypothetical protein